MSEKRFQEGLERRKRVLGEAHVARAMDQAPEFTRDFQDFMTEYVWGGVWSAGGITSLRERSLIVTSILCALGKGHEMRLHMRGALRNGVTPEELKSVIYHILGYCGAPAALECFRAYAEAKAAFDAEQAAK